MVNRVLSLPAVRESTLPRAVLDRTATFSLSECAAHGNAGQHPASSSCDLHPASSLRHLASGILHPAR
jgi:hypothetical protein